MPMEIDFVRQRITELRLKKGVSESAMSLALGHSRSYVTQITSGRANPSVSELLYIIEYFGITPQVFFTDPQETDIRKRLCNKIMELPDRDISVLLPLVARLEQDK